MFHLLWLSSLIFIILVGFNAVLQVNSQMILAAIKSNKTIRNEIETSQIRFESIIDKVIAVRVADNFYASTAQLQFRRFPAPEEQVCNAFWFWVGTAEHGVQTHDYSKAEQSPDILFHPEFGFLTLANNIALTQVNFDRQPVEAVTVKVSRNTILKVDDQLFWMASDKTDEYVKVVDFKKCEEAFDPKELYILDRNEQFCTTAPKAWADQTVEHFINGILFVAADKYNLNLVGIESMSNGKLSVATFVPYHCDFFKLVAGKELCQ